LKETASVSELGILGAIQMIVCIVAVVYVYLEYGLRLNFKKRGVFYSLEASQQRMRGCCTQEDQKIEYKAPDQYFNFHKEA
jgi:hypothetical protein